MRRPDNDLFEKWIFNLAGSHDHAWVQTRFSEHLDAFDHGLSDLYHHDTDENQAIYAKVLAEEHDWAKKGANDTHDVLHPMREAAKAKQGGTPYEGMFEEKHERRHRHRKKNVAKGAVAGTAVAGTAVAGTALAATGQLGPVGQAVAPIAATGGQVASVAKAAGQNLIGIAGAVHNLTDAHGKRNGHETNYDHAPDGSIQATEVKNELKRKKARRKEKKAAWELAGEVANLPKTAAKSMGLGEIGGTIAEEVLEQAPILGDVSRLAGGAIKAIDGGTEAYKHQQRKDTAREYQHAAETSGEGLDLALGNAKRSAGVAVGDHSAKAAKGTLTAISGATGLAAMGDPSGAALGVSLATRLAAKGMGGAMLAGRTIRKGYHQEKFGKMHEAAQAGDLDAIKYVMERDPSMASAQLLMHIQDKDNPEEQKFAKGAAMDMLGLREQAGAQLDTARLSDFNEVYHQAMGSKHVNEMSASEKAAWQVLEAPYKGYRTAKEAVSHKLGRDKDAKDDPHAAERLQKMSAAMEAERNAKSPAERDAIWARSGLSVIEREYMRTRDFMAQRTLNEMEGESKNRALAKELETGEKASLVSKALPADQYVAELSKTSAKKGVEADINRTLGLDDGSLIHPHLGGDVIAEEQRRRAAAARPTLVRSPGTRNLPRTLPSKSSSDDSPFSGYSQ